MEPVAAQPKRFHGTANLDSGPAGRDASRIADEVISHLVGLAGAEVTITIEIAATIPWRCAGYLGAHGSGDCHCWTGQTRRGYGVAGIVCCSTMTGEPTGTLG